jgi:hypothetical protein
MHVSSSYDMHVSSSAYDMHVSSSSNDRHVLPADQGETLLRVLSHAAPGLRALAVGGVLISDDSLTRLALCRRLCHLYLYQVL